MKAVYGALIQRSSATVSALPTIHTTSNPSSAHASRRKKDFFLATFSWPRFLGRARY